LGFRGFRLRGLEKVRGEFALMCAAHNLLKIVKAVAEGIINIDQRAIRAQAA
ncbi:transposase, partial [Desulfacinum hydrothermale]